VDIVAAQLATELFYYPTEDAFRKALRSCRPPRAYPKARTR
jgi:hypothetical protein